MFSVSSRDPSLRFKPALTGREVAAKLRVLSSTATAESAWILRVDRFFGEVETVRDASFIGEGKRMGELSKLEELRGGSGRSGESILTGSLLGIVRLLLAGAASRGAEPMSEIKDVVCSELLRG